MKTILSTLILGAGLVLGGCGDNKKYQDFANFVIKEGKENSLEMFKSLFDGSQEQPNKNYPTPYSKNDSLKYYRSSFYSLFV